ncbi:MAG TPA: energy transducer TonB [Crocinitomicaceae bacterium]|nr:energy transducer TonB [Crocinitomicaceae bacterium]
MKAVVIFSVIALFSSMSLAQPPVQPKDQNPEIETYVDEYAEFPGGRKELLKFLRENLRLPAILQEISYRGRSILKLVVSKEGSITNAEVIKGAKDCPECDAETIRVVKIMPKWIPAKKNGQIVNSYFILPVEFTLNKSPSSR